MTREEAAIQNARHYLRRALACLEQEDHGCVTAEEMRRADHLSPRDQDVFWDACRRGDFEAAKRVLAEVLV